MANVTLPYDDRGVASFEVGDVYLQKVLLAGDTPQLGTPFNYDLPNSSSFQQFSVVGIDSNNKLALATWNADPALAIKAIGVLPHARALGASGSAKATLWHSGHFNMDALVWDASFDTDAKKEAAFRGAPTPTTILIGKRLSQA